MQNITKTYFQLFKNVNIYYNYKKKQLILINPFLNYIIINLSKTTWLLTKNKIFIIQKIFTLFQQLILLKMLLQQNTFKHKYYITLNALGFKNNMELYSNLNILKLKLGYSHNIWIPFSNNINFLQLAENKFVIYSSILSIISNLSYYLYFIRPIDSYKGRGIWIKNTFPKLKIKKKTT